MGNFGGKKKAEKAKAAQEGSDVPKDTKGSKGERGHARRWSVLGSEDEPGRRLAADYILGKKLGEGSYGKVREAVSRKTGTRVAVKSVLKRNMRRLHTLRREIDIMKKMDHPNIIRLYDVYEDEAFLYIVMEMCSGGELFDRIIEAGYYTESDAVGLVRQILQAVAYLHEQQIAHRDLKPENFLFQSKSPDAPLKLIDFGLSRFYKENDFMKTRVGTPYYIAPEVLAKQYDKACDIWSVGVIMYILLCGYPPFYGDSERQIYTMIKKGEYDFPEAEWASVSTLAKDLIRLMLDVNPRTRIDASGAMAHPWFHQHHHTHHKNNHHSPTAAALSTAVSAPLPETSGSSFSSFESAENRTHLEGTNNHAAASVSFPEENGLDPHVIHRLRKFAQCNKLKRAALGVIVRYLNRDEINSLREEFEAIDTDGNGVVSVSELAQAMRNAGLDPSATEVERLAGILDEDGDGKIDYEEFLAASLDKKIYLRDELVETAFHYFDTDGSGFITTEDLQRRFGSQDPELLKSVFREYDVDQNGSIDLQEFKALMRANK